jgi:hypothetical protein
MAFDIENGILKKYIDNGKKESFIPDSVKKDTEQRQKNLF